jgi:type IV secretory pathway VirB10-like protein
VNAAPTGITRTLPPVNRKVVMRLAVVVIGVMILTLVLFYLGRQLKREQVENLKSQEADSAIIQSVAQSGKPQLDRGDDLPIKQPPPVNKSPSVAEPLHTSPDPYRGYRAGQRETSAPSPYDQHYQRTAEPAATGPALTEDEELLKQAVNAPLGRSTKPQTGYSRQDTPGSAPAALYAQEQPHHTDQPPSTEDEFQKANLQENKKAFFSSGGSKGSTHYQSTSRTLPLSAFEIRQGWEIPAVLEQDANSDLPGSLKALVAAPVYDTATGQYLLIPEGSRLIGSYSSNISYGQDRLQVAWTRIIYPDASSLELEDGFVGLDASGKAGMTGKVNNHYGRLFGMAAVAAVFSSLLEVTQHHNNNGAFYPSSGEVFGQAVAREMALTGTQITRKNLNRQPTLEIKVGSRFTVRVMKDIIFPGVYEPMYATPSEPHREQIRRAQR